MHNISIGLPPSVRHIQYTRCMCCSHCSTLLVLGQRRANLLLTKCVLWVCLRVYTNPIIYPRVYIIPSFYPCGSCTNNVSYEYACVFIQILSFTRVAAASATCAYEYACVYIQILVFTRVAAAPELVIPQQVNLYPTCRPLMAIETLWISPCILPPLISTVPQGSLVADTV